MSDIIQNNNNEITEIGENGERKDISNSDVGAPHRRERIWIVAYSGHLSRGNKEQSTIRKSKPYDSTSRPSQTRELANSDAIRYIHSKHEIDTTKSGQLAQRDACAESQLADTDNPASARQREHGRKILSLSESKGFDICGESISNAQRKHDEDAGYGTGEIRGERPETTEIQRCISNSDKSGLERRNEYRECSCQSSTWACCRAHEDERLLRSGICRVSHGVPKRMDRLKGLGNAIVPQIAEILWKKIKEYL